MFSRDVEFGKPSIVMLDVNHLANILNQNMDVRPSSKYIASEDRFKKKIFSEDFLNDTKKRDSVGGKVVSISHDSKHFGSKRKTYIEFIEKKSGQLCGLALKKKRVLMIAKGSKSEGDMNIKIILLPPLFEDNSSVIKEGAVTNTVVVTAQIF